MFFNIPMYLTQKNAIDSLDALRTLDGEASNC